MFAQPCCTRSVKSYMNKTFRTYAKEKGVSYEAIRRQVNETYKEELKDHIIKKGRTSFLDEFAQEFLDEKRRENPIIVQQLDKDESIEHLQNSVQELLVENTNLSRKNVKLSEELVKLTEEKSLLKIKNHELLLLESDFEKKKEEHEKSLQEIESKKEKILNLEKELEEKNKELDHLKHRNFWQRLFNK